MAKENVKSVNVRLPNEMAEWFERRASNNNRSMTGEFISILEKIRDNDRN